MAAFFGGAGILPVYKAGLLGETVN